MPLRDEFLKAQVTPDARKPRRAHPQGHEAEVRWEPKPGGGSQPAGAELSVPAGEFSEDERQWRELISENIGIRIPDDREVVLVSTTYWGQPGALNVRAKFNLRDRAPESPAGGMFDAPELLARLRAARAAAGVSEPRRPNPASRVGGSALVVSWNDWQLGKAEGGGSEATAARIVAAFDGVVRRVQQLRAQGQRIGRLVIVGGGDMVEGCDMFANHSWHVDADRRSQVRAVTALILEGLDVLAPLFERVTLLVVPGNHGENRIGHKRTTHADNDDVLVFEMAAQAASRDKRLKHVEFVLPDGEMSKTLEVAGWVLGTTHGHVYGKTASGDVAQKALKWYQAQAGAKAAIGDADVLLTHHYHHAAMRDWGGCLWLQSPAMDGGSAWFQDSSGTYAAPGMLTFVMSPEKRCDDWKVI